MTHYINALKTRWREPGGYKEILIISIPLIISTSSWSVQSFVDRMYLAWYSTESIAAAMPAGILNFTFMSFFIGSAGYVSTFTAQYYGAGHKEKIGPSIWQGIYLSAIGGLFIIMLIPLAPWFFKIAGHAPEIQILEIQYFSILCLGAFPAIAASSLSGFYSGLGKTVPIMWINICATAFNIIFDYILIFGRFGLPELGIRGAAIATSLAGLVSLILYTAIIFNKENNDKYRIISGFAFDRKLFRRLLRFGVPGGVQFFLDIAAFTFFLMFLGSLGTESLAASNISFSINTITFMPMIGIGIAISVLVGQNQGKNRPEDSVRSVWSGFHISFLYMGFAALLFILVPDFFINPFMRGDDPESLGRIKIISRVILKFIAFYTLFDSFNILFASALKGAGDTRFVMINNTLISVFVLVLPSYIFVYYLNLGIYALWGLASLYICVLGLSFLLRFLGGKWKTMKVIEEQHLLIPPNTPPPVPGVPMLPE